MHTKTCAETHVAMTLRDTVSHRQSQIYRQISKINILFDTTLALHQNMNVSDIIRSYLNTNMKLDFAVQMLFSLHNNPVLFTDTQIDTGEALQQFYGCQHKRAVKVLCEMRRRL